MTAAGARGTRAAPPGPRRSCGARRSGARSPRRPDARARGASRAGPRAARRVRARRGRAASAASRSSVTSWTRPIRSAVSASNRSPVTKYRRAALSPIFRSANGEMTAGTIPSFTSENANIVARSASTMSLHATSPMPPPSACPWTAATTGAGQPSIASSMRRSAFASATLPRSRDRRRRASTRRPRRRRSSARRPRRTTARAVPTSTNASASSAISAASNALRVSGRASVMRRSVAVPLDPERTHARQPMVSRWPRSASRSSSSAWRRRERCSACRSTSRRRSAAPARPSRSRSAGTPGARRPASTTASATSSSTARSRQRPESTPPSASGVDGARHRAEDGRVPRRPSGGARRRRDGAGDAFAKLSYSHRREYVDWVEEAKRPETRARRIAATVERVREGLPQR